MLDGRNINYEVTPKINKSYQYDEQGKNWDLIKDLSDMINALYKLKDEQAKQKDANA